MKECAVQRARSLIIVRSSHHVRCFSSMIDAPMSLPSDQDAIAAEPPPLRSVHTSNFPALLEQLGASLLVTTYQAGKLVVIRSDGDHINTHFRNFQSPMGLAVAGDRLAIGTTPWKSGNSTTSRRSRRSVNPWAKWMLVFYRVVPTRPGTFRSMKWLGAAVTNSGS